MISELMVNGNISHFIRSNRANRFALVIDLRFHSSAKLQLILLSSQLADAAEGLWYLHEKKIIHGDLKGVSPYRQWRVFH